MNTTGPLYWGWRDNHLWKTESTLSWVSICFSFLCLFLHKAVCGRKHHAGSSLHSALFCLLVLKVGSKDLYSILPLLLLFFVTFDTNVWKPHLRTTYKIMQSKMCYSPISILVLKTAYQSGPRMKLAIIVIYWCFLEKYDIIKRTIQQSFVLHIGQDSLICFILFLILSFCVPTICSI